MIKCFKTKYLMTYISTFLTPFEIKKLLSCNKDLRTVLNPSTNSTINIIFYNYVHNHFFEIDEYDVLHSKKNRNYLFEDSWKSSINWNLYLNQILGHFQMFPDKNITKRVIKYLKIHLYLSDLRKENCFLEFSDSSIHLLISYDIISKDVFTYNYYGKFINDDYINNHGNGCEIKILKENLFFERELKNFITIYNEVISNAEVRNLITFIINYELDKMGKFYEIIINSKMNNNINYILYFILWCSNTFIFYCNEIIESINRYENDEDEINYLNEYVTKYNNYVNAALLINSNFRNINIIINFLNILIIKINKDGMFSLYELSRKIFDKIVFSKISEKIIIKTSILFNKYLIGETDKTGKNNKIEKIDKMDIDKEDTSDTSINMDDSLCEVKIEQNYPKSTIEYVVNSVLDNSINKNNANAICHSNVILNEVYEELETSLLKELNGFICDYLNKNNSVEKLFQILEKLFKIETISRNSFYYSNNEFNFINRTNKKFINEIHKILFSHILKILSCDFKAHLEIKDNKRILKISDSEFLNNKENISDLSDLPIKKIIAVENKVKDELNNIKILLCQENMMEYGDNEINQLVEKYMDNNGIELVLLAKKMLYHNFKENELCRQRDEKIYSILSDKLNENEFQFMKDIIKI